MCTILALLVSTKIEIDFSSTTNDSGDIPKSESAKKGKANSKKKATQTKETSMTNLNTLSMRVKVGGAKVALALAGVRRQP